MSSAVVSTSAALGRPFVFNSQEVPEVPSPGEPQPGSPPHARPPQPVRSSGELAASDPKLARITPASQLEIRPAPQTVSSGVPALDEMIGGLPRGCLTEICGPASSGRTSLLLAALAAATRRGEFCVVVDATDSLDPHSAAAAGVEMTHMLWVRCGEDSGQHGKSGKPASTSKTISRNSASPSENSLEQVLRATDLLLESGGFGLIVLDLGDIPTPAARRIPLTTWFRFRRAVENKSTILLAIEQQPIAGSCSSLLLQLGSADKLVAERQQIAAHSLPRASRGGASRGSIAGNVQALEERKKMNLPAQPELDFPCHPHTQLFTGLDITAELIRSRLDRKPVRPVMFATKTAWAG